VAVELERGLPGVMADENQIYQALLNLCVNARDAMREGGRLVIKTAVIDGSRLAARDGGTAERYVHIEIGDTGTGIPEAIRNRVFEPFFTTKAAGEGTGLGLAVVYGIVNDRQGFVDFDSAPGRGSTFHIYLPVLPASAPLKAEGVFGEADRAARESGGKRLRVLIVEDEESMLHVLRNHLAGQGYRVFTAADGESAIETYRRYKGAIDVVLLDIDLPKLSGTEVLRRIRAESPDARFVVASGYLEAELESALAVEGVSRFVRKPYTPEALLAALESAEEK
jgi:two-component system cell cycle sensor histidine kinase/response regulator CckA